MKAISFCMVRRLPPKCMRVPGVGRRWYGLSSLPLRDIIARIVKGVKGGIPQISCHTVTTNESVVSSVANTLPEQSILVGVDQKMETSRRGPLGDSI